MRTERMIVMMVMMIMLKIKIRKRRGRWNANGTTNSSNPVGFYWTVYGGNNI